MSDCIPFVLNFINILQSLGRISSLSWSQGFDMRAWKTSIPSIFTSMLGWCCHCLKLCRQQTESFFGAFPASNRDSVSVVVWNLSSQIRKQGEASMQRLNCRIINIWGSRNKCGKGSHKDISGPNIKLPMARLRMTRRSTQNISKNATNIFSQCQTLDFHVHAWNNHSVMHHFAPVCTYLFSYLGA